MVRYDEDDPLGAKSVARPDISGKGAPPPPVEYVDPFDTEMEEGTKGSGFGKMLGRRSFKSLLHSDRWYRLIILLEAIDSCSLDIVSST